MGFLRDYFTRSGRDERAVKRWEEIATRSEMFSPMPGWAGPPITATMNYGVVGAPVMMSLMAGNLADALYACAWSFIAVTKTAAELAQLPPMVQVKKDGKWTRDDKHPLNELITRPHGPADTPPNWSWSQLIQCIATHLQMDQNGCVLRIAEAFDNPVALWPLIFDPLVIDEDSRHFPAQYRYGNVKLKPQEVVHFTLPHPSSYTKSLPPFVAALRAVKIDAVSAQRTEANVVNRLAPGCIIRVPGLMSISGPKRDQTLAYVREQCGTSNLDGMPIVGGDGWEIVAAPPTYQNVGLSPTRMEARREVLGVHGMPEALAITVETDRASIKEKRVIWWDLTLFPHEETIYNTFNRQLVSPYYGDDVRLWYDLSGSQIALALLSDRCGVAQLLVDMGYPTNMAADRVQLDMPRHAALDEPNQAKVIAGREPGNGKGNGKPKGETVFPPEPAQPRNEGEAA